MQIKTENTAILILCVLILSSSLLARIGSSNSFELIQSGFVYDQAPFEQCHASTIVELPDGDFYAAWFGGKREGDKSVAIWGSRYHDGEWSGPEELVRHSEVPCWNPVLFRVQDTIWLSYKFGENPREWSGAYLKSNDGAKTWSDTTFLPAGLHGPIKNKPIIMDNGDIVCGTSIESYKTWACWVEISSDHGETWHKYGPVTVPGERLGIIQPTVWETEPGHLKMLVRSTKRIGAVCESVSNDGGKTWSPAKPTALPNPNSGIDAVKMKNGAIALVYNHTKQGRSPLNVAVSSDNGQTWSDPFVLEDEPGEYSYPAIIQAQNGDLHIIYTWKRTRIKHVVLSF